MPTILLLETATETCSVAISSGSQLLALVEEEQANRHAEVITLLIKACLEKAGIEAGRLDAIAVSRGPGSYTSLRTGASAAKGLCYALDIPLIAVDTLQALALGSAAGYPGEEVLHVPMIDARRDEVWTSVFTASGQPLGPPVSLILQNNLLDKYLLEMTPERASVRYVFSGNGAKKIESGMMADNFVFSEVKRCSARYLAGPAAAFFINKEFQDVAYFEPFYMKPPNITVPRNKAGL